MEDQSGFVNEGMENIKRTQSALQSLEAKLNQYVSKSRDSTEKRPKQPPFIMPTIYFDFSSKKPSHPTTYKPSRQSTPQHPIQPHHSLLLRNQPPPQSQFEYYKHRLKLLLPSSTPLSKVQQFYQKRTTMLQEKVRELQERRMKVKKDKELLMKQNQRLNGEIEREERERKRRKVETEGLEVRGRKVKEERVRELREEVRREREVAEGLKVQVESYQSSLRLMLELQKNLTSIDVESRELKKRSTTNSKSKSTISKPPPNKHRQCCASTFASTQKTKSKSVTAK